MSSQTQDEQKRRKRILVVEDHEPLWHAIRQACRGEEEWDFHFFSTAETALKQFRCESTDAALVDLRLPCMSGMDFLERLHSIDLKLPVIILTAQADPDTVVRCIRAGAYDYISKPFRNEDLLHRLRRAVEARGLAQRVAHFESESYLASLMGPSTDVSRIAKLIAQVSPTEMAVLIEGESGTGKELLTRRIHALSRRSGGPFVAVDCGAIPENLLESELFGHRKGSFTGAACDREGKFQAAHDGTLFLDEIENLPLPMQAKLLRVLQQREVTPIGANRSVPITARVISASNSLLKAKVEKQEFRLDLYHRVAEFPISIPPLRERIEDLQYLATHFLREACGEFSKQMGGFTAEAWEELLGCKWPGNARELRSVIRRATLLSDGRIERLALGTLAASAPTHASTLLVENNTFVRAQALIPQEALREGGLSFKAIMRRLTGEIERCILIRVLDHAGGNKSLAARILDLDYKTLHMKVDEYGIKVERDVKHDQAKTTGC